MIATHPCRRFSFLSLIAAALIALLTAVPGHALNPVCSVPDLTQAGGLTVNNAYYLASISRRGVMRFYHVSFYDYSQQEVFVDLLAPGQSYILNRSWDVTGHERWVLEGDHYKIMQLSYSILMTIWTAGNYDQKRINYTLLGNMYTALLAWNQQDLKGIPVCY
jgi:hypothetical protein